MKVFKAYLLASRAHWRQVDKAGQPYIKHPRYVASRFRDKNCKIVALLHDTVEDSFVSLSLIEKKFGTLIRDAVDAITKRPNEDYDTYLERVKCNDLAKRVKLVDIYHNLDFMRLGKVDDKTKDRMRKYLTGLSYLLELWI